MPSLFAGPGDVHGCSCSYAKQSSIHVYSKINLTSNRGTSDKPLASTGSGSPFQRPQASTTARHLVALRAFQWQPPPPQEKLPTVNVRLSVHYRMPKRQMLCVGGDKLPFGWSFMSIAHVPMTWNPGDVWTVDVRIRPPPCSSVLQSPASDLVDPY